MKYRFRLLFTAALSFPLFGCSLYQSEGRKFLEKQAFNFRNQGLSIAVTQQKDNCAEAVDIQLDFFKTNSWKEIGSNIEYSYSLYEDTDPQLYSFVVAVLPEDSYRGMFICEYVYENKSEMQTLKNDDISEALQIINSMLN